MRAVADKLLGFVRRFAARRGIQVVDIALAFVTNGTLAAGFLVAAKLARALSAVVARG